MHQILLNFCQDKTLCKKETVKIVIPTLTLKMILESYFWVTPGQSSDPFIQNTATQIRFKQLNYLSLAYNAVRMFEKYNADPYCTVAQSAHAFCSIL